MADLPGGFEPPREDPADVMVEMQREMLERLTGARWLLNSAVAPGDGWVHPAGPSDPFVGPDTSIPTYVINPCDVTACLARIVRVQPPQDAASS